MRFTASSASPRPSVVHGRRASAIPASATTSPRGRSGSPDSEWPQVYLVHDEDRDQIDDEDRQRPCEDSRVAVEAKGHDRCEEAGGEHRSEREPAREAAAETRGRLDERERTGLDHGDGRGDERSEKRPPPRSSTSATGNTAATASTPST